MGRTSFSHGIPGESAARAQDVENTGLRRLFVPALKPSARQMHPMFK
jgi:hypothetical protein